ncbi:MAG: hypothetical protein KF705_04645 [Phycisphaeraceae bacterium]|nr:hypothetical protein [Phycisphaeraceae bacterium]
MRKNPETRNRRAWMGHLAAGLIGIGAALSPMTALAQTKAPERVAATDQVIFNSGRIVEGKILSETDSKLKMLVVIGGMSVETEYDKSEILSIKRDAITPESVDAAPASTQTRPAARSSSPVNPVADGTKVYTIHLKGWFGEDISQTPLREAVRDARQNQADYLIVIMENDWDMKRFGNLGEIPNEVGFFDQFRRAEDMDPIFTVEIPREWEKQPKVVFWVKRAMGGAAFLPLVCKDIYFSSDAKLGGIGGLEKSFGSTGDEVVREKQFSLRIGRAEGMAITGGYDPRLIRALARTEYVLSVGFEGGRPVYHEGMPRADRGEILLTDDGQGENEDNIQQLARGEGNDNLTLKADIAFKIGVSKGTVDSLEDLMRELGIARTYTLIPGKSDQIFKNWSEGLQRASRDSRKLWEDYQRIQVGGSYEERRRARGQQIRLLDDLEKVLKRYEEALNPGQLGLPGIGDIGILRERIKLDQLRDRK